MKPLGSPDRRAGSQGPVMRPPKTPGGEDTGPYNSDSHNADQKANIPELSNRTVQFWLGMGSIATKIDYGAT